MILVKRDGKRVYVDDNLKELGNAPVEVKPLRHPEPLLLRSVDQAKQCQSLGIMLDKTDCGAEVYSCSKHGTCSLQKRACGTAMAFCLQCTNYQTKQIGSNRLLKASSTASKIIRIDETNFLPEYFGKRLNGSLMPYQAGYLFAWRNDWGNASIWAVKLDKEMKPIGMAKRLGLNHRYAMSGREDPRVFMHKGKPHVWFTGWMGMRTAEWCKANVLFARLSDDLETEDIFFPDIPNRHSWEKNHAYFEYNNYTHCVYSISPHVVHQVYCNRVVKTYKTDSKINWRYGHMRGGASPVLHQGNYWHFFHGMSEVNGSRLYSIGIAVFEGKPPFKIIKVTHEPLDVAVPDNSGFGCIFPCGAFHEGKHWVISCGVQDKWIEFRYYSDQQVDAVLDTLV